MVTPGKNLDFSETIYYTAKVAPAASLANAITEHLKNWPTSGKNVCGKVRRFAFKHGGQTFEVVYCRDGQVIGLMNLFELPTQEVSLKDYLKTIQEIERSQKSRRKP